MIKNIVFDLAGVLIEYDPSDYIASIGYDGERAESLKKLIMEGFYWDSLDVGGYDSFESAIRAFIAQYPASERDIRAFFSPGWMQIYREKNDSVRWFYELKDRGYNTYILSNYSNEGFDYLKGHCEFIGQADGQVISAHVMLRKPDRRIYDILLDRYDLTPSETIFIDDIRANVDAAIARGIRGVVFEGLERTVLAVEALLKQA